MRDLKIPVAEYGHYADKFDPDKFDAETWVKIAKAAGQKYIVITAKHHDGFAMFPSTLSAFNIRDASPFKRDPLRELSEACKHEGIKLGFYYSQANDWHHPGGAVPHSDGETTQQFRWDPAQDGDMDAYLETVAVPQVKELLANYPDLAVLWFDYPVDMTPARSAKFYSLMEQYPKLIINNRLGPGFRGDFLTPEQFIPATGYPGEDWETCMTLNNHWGYCMDDDQWKSAKDLIHKLAEVAGKGGNFLLNVGPTSQGEIPAPSVERLRQVGQWIDKNGVSIYGTSAGPFPHLSWGYCTRKNDTLYLHVINWPTNGQLHVPIQNEIYSAFLLERPMQKIHIKREPNRIIMTLPVKPLDPDDTVIACSIQGEPLVKPPASYGKQVTASSVDNPMDVPAHVADGLPDTLWLAAKDARSGWLQVDLGKPTEIGCSIFDQYNDEQLPYKVEYLEDGQWKSIAEGESDRHGGESNFSPVVAQIFRLEFPATKSPPAIREWQVFPPE